MAINYPASLDTDASLGKAVNNCADSLASAYTAGGTTLTLTSAALFPTTGGIVFVASERTKYTGVTGNQLTGVTALAGNYPSGTSVQLVVDAEHHNNLKDALIALETKVGVTGDTTAGTHAKRLSDLEAAVGPDNAAIEALSSIGILVRTAANTWALRVLTGTANEITVTNGDGVAGAPTLSLPTALTFTGKTVTGGTFSGAVVTLTADPTNALDAATKQYVDSVAAGLDVKPSVKVATTAAITLSGAQTIDGVSVVAGDRVLVKNQASASANGIYVAAAGAWSRATDMDAWVEIPGSFTFVEQGSTYADCAFVCTADAGGTLGTTAINWSQFAGVGTFTAGSGLVLNGTQFSISTTYLETTIHAATAKATPADADEWGFWDSVSGALRKFTWANLKAALKSYFDPIYATVGLGLSSISADYTFVLGDANNGFLHPAADTTARTATIPANASVAYPVGTTLTFINQHGAGVWTIAITTDTMRLAGAGTTGSRSLAADGMATAVKITSTEWIISGVGLT